jgi:hypothetical protein
MNANFGYGLIAMVAYNFMRLIASSKNSVSGLGINSPISPDQSLVVINSDSHAQVPLTINLKEYSACLANEVH